jgi:hypothetical protein
MLPIEHKTLSHQLNLSMAWSLPSSEKGKEKTATVPTTIPAERVDRCPVCMPRPRPRPGRESDAKCMFSEFETVDADVVEDDGAFW